MKFCFLGKDCFRKGELATIFIDALLILLTPIHELSNIYMIIRWMWINRVYLQFVSRFVFEVVILSHFKVFICIVEYAFVQPYGLFLESCTCGWKLGCGCKTLLLHMCKVFFFETIGVCHNYNIVTSKKVVIFY
jgi:hypothetical protein